MALDYGESRETLTTGEVQERQGYRRGSYLLLSDFERLEEWCRLVRVVFDGECPYLVGSFNGPRNPMGDTAAVRDARRKEP